MLLKKSLLIFSFFSFLLMAQNPVRDIALYKAVFEEKISWKNYGQQVRKMVPVQKEILNGEMQQRADFLVTKEKLTLEKNTYHNKNYFISDELVLYILD